METLPYLHTYLERNAEQFPHKPAFVYQDSHISWSELSVRVHAAAIGLTTYLQEPTEQQIVGLFMSTSLEFVIAYLAIVASGNIALPLDLIFKRPELEAIIQQINPSLVIVSESSREILSSSMVPICTLTELPDSSHMSSPLVLPPEQQIASMLFTSGTTGRPKAAPYTHTNHLWNIEASSLLYEWTSNDTLLLSLPLSHWHGLVMGISGALYHGNTVYLQERLDPEITLNLLASGTISLFMHVSLAYSKLAQYAPERTWDLSSVRLCLSASSALPPPVWQTFKERFDLEILECYGSSEAGRIASNQLHDRVPGSPGKALPGGTLKLSEGGEVLVKSPGIFPGYWHNEEATRNGFAEDGYWKTGDIGEFDSTGHLFLKGRIQERIKKQGYSVFPRDVEWALQDSTPEVMEVFVMGVQTPNHPDDQIIYFVVGTISEEEILQHSKERMPFAWRPDRIIFLESIPRTRSGKPILASLRALL